MNIKNNPVVNTGRQFVGLTVYLLVLFAAFETSIFLYTKYSPVVKWKAQRLYRASASKARKAKGKVIVFAKVVAR